MQAIIRQRVPEQLSNVQLREWQKYRGYSIRILQELEHSGGKTTRMISDGIGCRCVAATNILCRMLKIGLVERVERWGWRITRDGIFLLSLSLNTTTTSQQHHNNTTTTSQDVSGTFQAYQRGETVMPKQELPQETEAGPRCYQATTCHIRRLCKDKRYTLSNQERVCQTCIHDDTRKDIPGRFPVETKGMGSHHQTTLAEVQHA